MSIAAAKNFAMQVASDNAFARRFLILDNSGEQYDFARRSGFNFSVDDVNSAILELIQDRQVRRKNPRSFLITHKHQPISAACTA